MSRVILGALGALVLVTIGLFWWQGRAETEVTPTPSSDTHKRQGIWPEDSMPTETGEGLKGGQLPEASEVTREEKRFNRLDRNRDGRITRNEMLAPRVSAFRKLDKDGNNLLSFEEWAISTSTKFHKADRDGDRILSRSEFATTKPAVRATEGTSCACNRRASASSKSREEALDNDDQDE